MVSELCPDFFSSGRVLYLAYGQDSGAGAGKSLFRVDVAISG